MHGSTIELIVAIKLAFEAGRQSNSPFNLRMPASLFGMFLLIGTDKSISTNLAPNFVIVNALQQDKL